MQEVVLQIPSVEAEQNIEIDVKINGRRKTLKYRVEIVGWETHNPTTEEKVGVLRKVIGEHAGDWQLVTIGAPRQTHIPIMFRKRDVAQEASR